MPRRVSFTSVFDPLYSMLPSRSGKHLFDLWAVPSIRIAARRECGRAPSLQNGPTVNDGQPRSTLKGREFGNSMWFDALGRPQKRIRWEVAGESSLYQ